MKKTLREFCGESGQSQLLEQWDAQRNHPLTPDLVTYGSKRKVWWRCERGHAWKAAVKSRVAGSGCPVCANRKILLNENDLATEFPEIAAQWHPEKDGILTPQQVTPCSNRKIWWKCELGHSYQAVIGARTMSGNGCPY